MSYKRNQIEEAIARIFDPSFQKPPSELRTRIKRLLELDRSIGRKVRPAGGRHRRLDARILAPGQHSGGKGAVRRRLSALHPPQQWYDRATSSFISSSSGVVIAGAGMSTTKGVICQMFETADGSSC